MTGRSGVVLKELETYFLFQLFVKFGKKKNAVICFSLEHSLEDANVSLKTLEHQESVTVSYFSKFY